MAFRHYFPDKIWVKQKHTLSLENVAHYVSTRHCMPTRLWLQEINIPNPETTRYNFQYVCTTGMINSRLPRNRPVVMGCQHQTIYRIMSFNRCNVYNNNSPLLLLFPSRLHFLLWLYSNIFIYPCPSGAMLNGLFVRLYSVYVRWYHILYWRYHIANMIFVCK